MTGLLWPFDWLHRSVAVPYNQLYEEVVMERTDGITVRHVKDLREGHEWDDYSTTIEGYEIKCYDYYAKADGYGGFSLNVPEDITFKDITAFRQFIDTVADLIQKRQAK